MPNQAQIDIENFAFNPSTAYIATGDTVTWTNEDSSDHTATSDTGNEIASVTLSKDKSYDHTFSAQGTYAYHCALHPGMRATIVVS